MRVTIIVVDNMVYVEGHAESVDCSSLDDDIHAIQWYDGRGEIEYKMNHIDGIKKMNFTIIDFAPYQYLVDLWMLEAQKPLPQPVQPAAVHAPQKSSGSVRVIAT